MIACTRCGHRTGEDEEAFCVSCGAFLPWTGQLLEQPPAPVVVAALPPPPAPEPPAPRGLRAWLRRRIYQPWRDQWLPFERSIDSDETEEAPAILAAPAALAEPPAPRPVTRTVLPRSPGRPSSRHHLIEVEEDDGLPFGATLVACPNCAIANPDTRVLCRRCGVELLPPPVLAELAQGDSGYRQDRRQKWLPLALGLPDRGGNAPALRTRKRALPAGVLRSGETEKEADGGEGEGTGEGGAPAESTAQAAQKKAQDAQKRVKGAKEKGKKALKKLLPGKQKNQPVPAGGRPGKWGRTQYAGGNRSMLIVSRAGGAVIVVGLVLSFVGPVAQPLRNGATRIWHDVRAKFTIKYVPVAPIGAVASSASPGFPATNAIDNVVNDSWQTAEVSDGVGQWITITFPHANRISAVGVLSGDQSTPQSYRTEARPKTLAFYWSNGNRTTETLIDQAGFQSFHVSERSVRSVRVVITSVYPSPTGHRCAIAQLEFFHLT